MQNATSWVLFLLFGIVLVVMYMGIRRRLLSPVLISAGGVLLSIVLMTTVGVSQGNTFFQALFVGFLIGGLFSIGTLAMASYFLRRELRAKGQ